MKIPHYISIMRLTDIIVKYKLCIFSLILDKFLYGNMTDGLVRVDFGIVPV